MNTQKLTIGYTASLFIQWIVAESFHVAIAVEESRKVIEEVFTNDYTWAIELKETGEALVKMIDYCFNAKGFENLWSDFFVDNPASGHLILDEFNENIHLLRW